MFGRVNRTTILMWGLGAFFGGLVLGRFVHISFWVCISLMSLFAVSLRRKTFITILLIVLVGASVGVWRGSTYFARLQPYRQLAMQKVNITATASADGFYEYEKPISFVVGNITMNGRAVPGHIKVSGFGPSMVFAGDRVQVSGKLYPTRGANQASIGYAQIQLLTRGGSWLQDLRRKFAAGMQSALPEPLASFGLGLLVGQRNTLPADLTQALLMVGLTHIIAVSGYNLTVLINASRRAFGERSKNISTALTVLLIFGFLAVAGNSASIVRAAVISLLGLSAWYYGRTVRPLLLLLLASVLTSFANPNYLWADISWYLSFLAFFGILLIAPQITRLLYGTKQPKLIPQIVIETLCAEIMTLPLILYIFGQLSLVSLLANMLVCALIPLAMLLSFVAGLAGMFMGVVSGWFAWPARVLLGYMVDIVNLLASIPHVFQSNRYISAVDMAAVYALVSGLLLFVYWRRKRHRWFDSISEN